MNKHPGTNYFKLGLSGGVLIRRKSLNPGGVYYETNDSTDLAVVVNKVVIELGFPFILDSEREGEDDYLIGGWGGVSYGMLPGLETCK